MEQNVVWFDVSVYDIFLIQSLECIQELFEIADGIFLRNSTVIQNTIQKAPTVAVLIDVVEFVMSFNNFIELYNILVG